MVRNLQPGHAEYPDSTLSGNAWRRRRNGAAHNRGGRRRRAQPRRGRHRQCIQVRNARRHEGLMAGTCSSGPSGRRPRAAAFASTSFGLPVPVRLCRRLRRRWRSSGYVQSPSIPPLLPCCFPSWNGQALGLAAARRFRRWRRRRECPGRPLRHQRWRGAGGVGGGYRGSSGVHQWRRRRRRRHKGTSIRAAPCHHQQHHHQSVAQARSALTGPLPAMPGGALFSLTASSPQ